MRQRRPLLTSAPVSRVEALVGEEPAALSVITVSELLHGALRADAAHRLTRTAFVEAILHGYVSVQITHRVARVHAGLWSQLATAGHARHPRLRADPGFEGPDP